MLCEALMPLHPAPSATSRAINASRNDCHFSFTRVTILRNDMIATTNSGPIRSESRSFHCARAIIFLLVLNTGLWRSFQALGQSQVPLPPTRAYAVARDFLHKNPADGDAAWQFARTCFDLAAVDDGMPADLRLDPDVEHAHSVAASGGATVYFASLAGGGYCAELVTRGRGRGAVCSSAAATDRTPLSVTIPFTDPVTDDSPVTVSGHVSRPDARSVELVYPDGGRDTVSISPERFYVAEVPEAHLAAVHRRGMLLVARGAGGEPVAEAVVPFDAVTPLPESEVPKDPIEVETVTDNGDMSRLLRIRGALHVAAATRLELRYPDGDRVGVPIDGNAFDLALPAGRRGSLAREPGELTAYAADGRVVATRPVAAVSYWHARER